MTNPTEWRPVVGHEGNYEVSNHGEVRSVERVVRYSDGRTRHYPSVTLRQPPNTNGYHRVNIDGRSVKVHLLVAAAFLGPRPDGHDVCHNNGDRSDNSARNLRYDTRSNNLKDAVLHRTNKNTLKTHCPKGHPYQGENLVINSKGRRECRTCNRTRARLSWARKSARL